ncbi:MAG: class I SAM-dependent rRNA methyltransferase [Myxococcales bacterium]|jgi:23S rRNA (cytosine1962-C5)-methyltransferase|nr:class I SAM-dependent rRNA methyltransferase [Myxococcales bacterium]
MTEHSIAITRRGDERVEQGLPWIYRADLKSVPKGLTEGAIVRVVDGRGWFKGRAFYSSQSQIALRLLTREDVACDRAFFADRLRAALALRERLFPGETTYRLVHGDADLLSGIVIDRYGDVLCIQLLTQAADALRELFVSLLRELFPGTRAIIERSDAKVRLLEGLEPIKRVLFGEAPGPIELREGDVTQRIDPMEGQKTGGFLDQRENHLLAARFASGLGLDCFSYTGGFALQLAKHGCTRVTAVECSESASALLMESAARNGLSNVEVTTANVFDFLKAQSMTSTRYDTIVLDPPSFAKNKGAIEGALRGYKEINLRAMQLLKPGGHLISASCSFHVDEAGFEQMLHAAACDAKRSVQIVERRGASRDHPVLLGVRETRYLKCFFLRVL